MTQDDTSDKECSNNVVDASSEDWSEAEADYLTNLVTPEKLNARSRAAPFYNELAPGWRARARFLAPPFTSRHANLHRGQMGESKAMAEGDLPGMDDSSDEDQSGRSTNRSDEAPEQNREEKRATLGNE